MECLLVNKLPEGELWLYEVKLDGYRAILVKDGKTISLYSRYGNSLAKDFPEWKVTTRPISPTRQLSGVVFASPVTSIRFFRRISCQSYSYSAPHNRHTCV
jgi:ATP-dependent DNA ligase